MVRMIAKLLEVKATDKDGQITISLKLETKPQTGLSLSALENFIGIGTLEVTFGDLQSRMFPHPLNRETGEIG